MNKFVAGYSGHAAIFTRQNELKAVLDIFHCCCLGRFAPDNERHCCHDRFQRVNRSSQYDMIGTFDAKTAVIARLTNVLFTTSATRYTLIPLSCSSIPRNHTHKIIHRKLKFLHKRQAAHARVNNLTHVSANSNTPKRVFLRTPEAVAVGAERNMRPMQPMYSTITHSVRRFPSSANTPAGNISRSLFSRTLVTNDDHGQ